jgi:hypothetical protein
MEGGLRGLSQWVQLCTWCPNTLWISNFIWECCPVKLFIWWVSCLLTANYWATPRGIRTADHVKVLLRFSVEREGSEALNLWRANKRARNCILYIAGTMEAFAALRQCCAIEASGASQGTNSQCSSANFQPWHISPPDFGTKLFITWENRFAFGIHSPEVFTGSKCLAENIKTLS